MGDEETPKKGSRAAIVVLVVLVGLLAVAMLDLVLTISGHNLMSQIRPFGPGGTEFSACRDEAVRQYQAGAWHVEVIVLSEERQGDSWTFDLNANPYADGTLGLFRHTCRAKGDAVEEWY